MAYRRRQSNPRSLSTFQEVGSGIRPPDSPKTVVEVEPEPPSLAAQAIRASSAHRDSSISAAYYGDRTVPSPSTASSSNLKESTNRESRTAEYTSLQNLNESKYGFWGVLARKAKALIDDDSPPSTLESDSGKSSQTSVSINQVQQSYESLDGYLKPESIPSPRNSDSIASSLNHIGGTIKNKLGEGLAMVENKTADIIQETKKINIRRRSGSSSQNQAVDKSSMHNFPQVQADHETQLKASRDVANAMAAKAKLLLRELKTVKADLAFAKERCAQLEEENKMLRESHDKSGPEDDDLIRLQLETLLAEKGRLAHENSLYARENRFLREIVEYHQLTMQDVVYVDEVIEEVTEVFSNSPSQILSRNSTMSNSFNNNRDEFSTTPRMKENEDDNPKV